VTGSTIDRQPAVTPHAATVSAQPGLGRRESAVLWAPWAVLATGAVLSMLLAGGLSLALFEARAGLEQHRDTLRRFAAESSSGPAATVLEDVAAQLLLEPPRLLEYIEVLADQSGAAILQFLPDVTATGDGASPIGVRLQIQGAPAQVEGFLLGLGGPASAIELGSLRLAPAMAAGELLCEIALRLHDAESLAALGRSPDASVPALADVGEDLLSAAAFGLDTRGVAQMPAAGPPDAASADVPASDVLAGVRLAGLLRQGELRAALLEVPGEGMLLLRPAERVGETRFRLESAGPAAVVLASDRGERRTFELDTRGVVAP